MTTNDEPIAPMKSWQLEDATKKLQELFTPIKGNEDPVLSAVRGLTNIINDLSYDNRQLRQELSQLRKQYDALMTSYERMTRVSARLAGMPESLIEGVPDSELEAFKKSAKQAVEKVKEREDEHIESAQTAGAS